MNAHTTRGEARALRVTRQQAADLLSRYPSVSEAEARLILGFLRKGRHLDVGMLTADEALKPQLDAFTRDHKKQLGVGFGEGAAVLAAIAGFLLVCWLIWEVIKPGAV
jgi:predicted esterase